MFRLGTLRGNLHSTFHVARFHWNKQPFISRRHFLASAHFDGVYDVVDVHNCIKLRGSILKYGEQVGKQSSRWFTPSFCLHAYLYDANFNDRK